MTTTKKVAFLGLGVMGYPMAGHLRIKGGHDVTVYNRTAEKAEKWAKEFGGQHASTPAEAAQDADFVFACVGNDDDLRAVATGLDGAFSTMKNDAIFVDNTTASAQVARELDTQAQKRGFHFIDAPVSGGQAGAENGVLTVMVGATEPVFERARSVIDAYARFVGLMGPVGSGQLAKMVNQICIAGLVQGLAEGIHFGKKAGLDIEKLVSVISKGAAGSWQMENRSGTMNQGKYDFGFAVDWMRKDLGICLDEADRNGALLPVTALVDQFYKEVQKAGGGRWDTSSLLARLEQ
ncbi:NAD(P)-dependent oxidoreductase [Ochrobactrum sp. CM-21-5]|nr:NAD(P)-dependent oxidoreductase [Ochrobactrum sp. CM-21-5]MBC2886784.1 NAD(P)-dependent oxidoreductase [Ochrobactrum sp. CM-21-5]